MSVSTAARDAVYGINDRVIMRCAQTLDESGDVYTSQDLADMMAMAIIDEVNDLTNDILTLSEGLSSILADLMYMADQGGIDCEIVPPRA